jgi:hypothetical protein
MHAGRQKSSSGHELQHACDAKLKTYTRPLVRHVENHAIGGSVRGRSETGHETGKALRAIGNGHACRQGRGDAAVMGTATRRILAAGGESSGVTGYGCGAWECGHRPWRPRAHRRSYVSRARLLELAQCLSCLQETTVLYCFMHFSFIGEPN